MNRITKVSLIAIGSSFAVILAVNAIAPTKPAAKPVDKCAIEQAAFDAVPDAATLPGHREGAAVWLVKCRCEMFLANANDKRKKLDWEIRNPSAYNSVSLAKQSWRSAQEALDKCAAQAGVRRDSEGNVFP